MTGEPLTKSERYLAELAASSGADPLLADLVELADSGLPTSLGMFVDGKIVVGQLASSKVAAAEVDKSRSWLAERAQQHPPEDLSQEEFDERLKKFSTAASDAVAKQEQMFSEIWDEAAEHLTDDGFAFDKAPAALSQRVISALGRRFVTLQEVQIMAPGQTGLLHLPVLRIAITHIAAWWVIHLDAEGRASFQLFTTDPGS